jgi:hypothetical protein
VSACLRQVAEPFVAAPPGGARVRARLRVSPADEANDLTDFLDLGALAIRWPTFPGCRGWPRPVTPPRRWSAR